MLSTDRTAISVAGRHPFLSKFDAYEVDSPSVSVPVHSKGPTDAGPA